MIENLIRLSPRLNIPKTTFEFDGFHSIDECNIQNKSKNIMNYMTNGDMIVNYPKVLEIYH